MARLRGANHPPPASDGPKIPTLDYADHAAVCWLDAQYLATVIEESQERRRQIGERIQKGQAWLENHTADHPKWKRAQELLYLLEAQHSLSEWSIGRLHYDCWDQVCQTYIAYQHLSNPERTEWHREHHPTDVSSPRALWKWLDTGMGALDWPRQGQGGCGWNADGSVYVGFDWM